jgi:O-antigen/teichoic acid export membrane protein
LANLSTQPLTWAATLLGATFVPRLLGSETLGQLTIAFTITGLAGTVLDLGIITYITRRIAQDPGRARRDLGVAALIQAVTFGLGALVLAILIPKIAPELLDPRLLDVCLVSFVLLAAQSLLLTALRAQEHHVSFAWLRAAPWIFGPVACVLVLLAGGNVFAFMAAAIAVDVAGLLLTWRVLRQHPSLPRLNFGFLREAREFVVGGFPFLSYSLTLSVSTWSDRLLLGLFVPASEVGWYAAAYRIIGFPIFVPTLLVTPLFPAVIRAAQDPEILRRTIAQTVRLTLFITVPLSAGICVIAPLIPSLLGWGSDFEGAIPLLTILTLQVPVMSINIVLGTVIMAMGRERTWLKVGLVAAALSVSGNLVAIPFFEHVASNGAIGASITTVVTEVWMFVGALLVIPRQLLDSSSVWNGSRILVAGVAAGVIATLLMPIALFVSAIAGALTYLALALMLRVVSINDVRFLRDRLPQRFRYSTRTQPV